MAPTTNISDRWFSRLYVIGPREDRRWGQVLWDCFCECGTDTVATTRDLLDGRTRSCGCLQRDTTRRLFTTHGRSGQPEHRAWKHARGRCENPTDAAFAEYGGRGIKFHFPDFDQFLAHIGPRPTTPGVVYELDRIDVNGHYEEGNVRWWPKSKGMRRLRRYAKRPR